MKKNILLVATLVVIMASFVACKNEEPVASEPASSSEEVSELASEEMSSEEVSEVASSEDVIEDTADYSADSIMKLADELVAKYPIENPEHIKATLIMANLDKISEEDRVALFDAYGFTYETLEGTFKEYLESVSRSHDATVLYRQGSDDYKELAIFSSRMPITEVVYENNEYANKCYDVVLGIIDVRYDLTDLNSLYEEKVNSGNYSFADDVLSNYMWCTVGDIDAYESSYEKFGIETGN